jgi:glycosyltransferase involved in cell wall biosynthesis
MRILRIADVNDNLSGGMTRVMHLTTDPLVAAGHQVVTLFRDDLNRRTPARLRRFVVPFVVVRRVLQRLRAGEVVDVVEVHEPSAAVYCVARRIYPELPPILVLSHGLEARARLNFLAYRMRNGIPVSLKSRYSPLSVAWQANFALRNGDAVVCSTTEDFDYLQHRLKIPIQRIHFINWGVLPQYFADPRAPRKGILWNGSWIERKGIRDLVSAVVPLLEKRPGLHMTLAGCGLPAGKVAEHFPAAVHGQLRIIDRQISEDEQLIDLYLTHSIFVCASFFEGQSLTLLEAAASGIAIVTTNVGGMRDFIRHGQNGLLYEPGDAEALAAHLRHLVSDDVEARRLGDTARQDARPYTWERAAAKLLAAYQAAIDGHRRGVSTGGAHPRQNFVENR